LQESIFYEGGENMLFGLIKDKSPEQVFNNVSCALCSTIVSQNCATLISEKATDAKGQQFACFRCFAQIIIQRRQAKYTLNTSHKRAA
jgi:hypothetical protein